MRGRKGRFTISRSDGVFAETKIVYTDYEYAVIYNCDQVSQEWGNKFVILWGKDSMYVFLLI